MTGYFLADNPSSPPSINAHYISSSAVASNIASRILSFFDSLTDISDEKWSPQVVETLYWWFERWGYSYLFAETDSEGEKVLIPGGTEWSAVAKWAVARMKKDVVGWGAEPEIISQVRSRMRSSLTVDYSNFENFLEGVESEKWITCVWYLSARDVTKPDNMPDLVQYLINHISDLPQASHS